MPCPANSETTSTTAPSTAQQRTKVGDKSQKCPLPHVFLPGRARKKLVDFFSKHPSAVFPWRSGGGGGGGVKMPRSQGGRVFWADLCFPSVLRPFYHRISYRKIRLSFLQDGAFLLPIIPILRRIGTAPDICRVIFPPSEKRNKSGRRKKTNTFTIWDVFVLRYHVKSRLKRRASQRPSAPAIGSRHRRCRWCFFLMRHELQRRPPWFSPPL